MQPQSSAYLACCRDHIHHPNPWHPPPFWAELLALPVSTNGLIESCGIIPFEAGLFHLPHPQGPYCTDYYPRCGHWLPPPCGHTGCAAVSVGTQICPGHAADSLGCGPRGAAPGSCRNVLFTSPRNLCAVSHPLFPLAVCRGSPHHPLHRVPSCLAMWH